VTDHGGRCAGTDPRLRTLAAKWGGNVHAAKLRWFTKSCFSGAASDEHILQRELAKKTSRHLACKGRLAASKASES